MYQEEPNEQDLFTSDISLRLPDPVATEESGDRSLELAGSDFLLGC